MILNGTICFLHIKMRYLLLLSSRFLNEKVKSLNDQRIKKKRKIGDKKIALSEIAPLS